MLRHILQKWTSARRRGDPRPRPRDAGGLRPHLRRRLAGRSAGGRRRAARLRRSDRAVAPDRPRRRLAGQGRAPAGAARAPRGCRSAASGSTCAWRGCPSCRCDVGPARDHARRPGRAAFTSSRARCSSALPELDGFEVGLLHLLIQHTSASLALNENASPDVRRDFESWFNEAVPERAPLLDPHARGRRRHAGPHQGGAARAVADAAGRARPARRSGPGRASTCASTATTAGRGRGGDGLGRRG